MLRGVGTVHTAAPGTPQSGDHVEATKLTVKEYLEREWLPLQKAARKPSTFTGYEHIAKQRIIPAFGDTRLADLTMGDIAGFYTDLRASGRMNGGECKGPGLAERSIKHTHTQCCTPRSSTPSTRA